MQVEHTDLPLLNLRPDHGHHRPPLDHVPISPHSSNFSPSSAEFIESLSKGPMLAKYGAFSQVLLDELQRNENPDRRCQIAIWASILLHEDIFQSVIVYGKEDSTAGKETLYLKNMNILCRWYQQLSSAVAQSHGGVPEYAPDGEVEYLCTQLYRHLTPELLTLARLSGPRHYISGISLASSSLFPGSDWGAPLGLGSLSPTAIVPPQHSGPHSRFSGHSSELMQDQQSGPLDGNESSPLGGTPQIRVSKASSASLEPIHTQSNLDPSLFPSSSSSTQNFLVDRDNTWNNQRFHPGPPIGSPSAPAVASPYAPSIASASESLGGGLKAPNNEVENIVSVRKEFKVSFSQTIRSPVATLRNLLSTMSSPKSRSPRTNSSGTALGSDSSPVRTGPHSSSTSLSPAFSDVNLPGFNPSGQRNSPFSGTTTSHLPKPHNMYTIPSISRSPSGTWDGIVVSTNMPTGCAPSSFHSSPAVSSSTNDEHLALHYESSNALGISAQAPSSHSSPLIGYLDEPVPAARRASLLPIRVPAPAPSAPSSGVPNRPHAASSSVKTTFDAPSSLPSHQSPSGIPRPIAAPSSATSSPHIPSSSLSSPSPAQSRRHAMPQAGKNPPLAVSPSVNPSHIPSNRQSTSHIKSSSTPSSSIRLKDDLASPRPSRLRTSPSSIQGNEHHVHSSPKLSSSHVASSREKSPLVAGHTTLAPSPSHKGKERAMNVPSPVPAGALPKKKKLKKPPVTAVPSSSTSGIRGGMVFSRRQFRVIEAGGGTVAFWVARIKEQGLACTLGFVDDPDNPSPQILTPSGSTAHATACIGCVSPDHKTHDGKQNCTVSLRRVLIDIHLTHVLQDLEEAQCEEMARIFMRGFRYIFGLKPSDGTDTENSDIAAQLEFLKELASKCRDEVDSEDDDEEGDDESEDDGAA